MGCWGMGMTQTDEFCEVYDSFMSLYNGGKAVEDITASILAEYHSEFEDSDEVIHDVYFALAKAEWMCCAQSTLVLNRVKEIIESCANVRFYRELEATEKDMKQRQKNLEKFWLSLQTPREKPRQRRIDPMDREKELPALAVGECYRYQYDGGYRVFAVLGFNRAQGWRDMVCCAIFLKTYTKKELETVDFLCEPIQSISCYLGEELIGSSTIKKIASIPVPAERYSTSVPAFTLPFGKKKDFKAPFNGSTVFLLSDWNNKD